MVIAKIDGQDAEKVLKVTDLARDSTPFIRFLKENTHSGKVDPKVEIFKTTELECREERFHWVMSTYDVDRDFERIDPAGWNLENYRKNPVILWSHDYTKPAIGYAKDVKAGELLEGDIIFNDKETDPFGWSIGQRVKNGILRCGSVGFRVEEIEFIDHSMNPMEKAELIYRKQELLEFSICNVPANPFALNVPDVYPKEMKDVPLFQRLHV